MDRLGLLVMGDLHLVRWVPHGRCPFTARSRTGRPVPCTDRLGHAGAHTVRPEPFELRGVWTGKPAR
ncbi:hypothetical protein P1X14_18970 [Sphingomonas sp. AOB5]|uniref:hypothetical protein n=1 Tax=Sphingomonas sp. AOB5 TaxID=3034017 RepID=UPI0023F99BC3|nr:hypothetical protein [Sphingomonas sp. AOB5]MDF7777348.1 hypothetical protein [Sphingomonas sp. AOB5]